MPEPKLLQGRKPDADPVIKLMSEQILVIDRELYTKLMYYIDKAKDKECMWISRIVRVSEAFDDVLAYHVHDLFIPHQTVADKEVEATPQQLNEMWMEIKTQRNITNKELGELMATGCFWGHSHVTMPPKPSPQDEKQWKDWKGLCLAPDRTGEAQVKPVGMIILNQKEEYTNRVYDPEVGAEFHNLPLFIRDPIDYDYIDAAITAKLHKKEPPKTTSTPLSGTSNSWQGGEGTSWKGNGSATGKAAHSWSGGTTSSPTPQVQAQTKEAATSSKVTGDSSTPSSQTGGATGSSLTLTKSSYSVRGQIPRYWAIQGLETAIQDLEDQVARYWTLSHRDEICSRVEAINKIQLGDTTKLTAECRSLTEYLLIKGVYPHGEQAPCFTDWARRVAIATKMLETIGEGFKGCHDRKTIMTDVKGILSTFTGSLTDAIEYFRYEVIYMEQVFLFALTVAQIIDQIDHETEEGKRMNELAVKLIKDLIIVFEHASKI